MAVFPGLDGEVLEEVGVDEEEGFAVVVVKAKYSFVFVPGPHARYVNGPTLLGRVRRAVEQ